MICLPTDYSYRNVGRTMNWSARRIKVSHNPFRMIGWMACSSCCVISGKARWPSSWSWCFTKHYRTPLSHLDFALKPKPLFPHLEKGQSGSSDPFLYYLLPCLQQTYSVGAAPPTGGLARRSTYYHFTVPDARRQIPCCRPFPAVWMRPRSFLRGVFLHNSQISAFCRYLSSPRCLVKVSFIVAKEVR